MENKVRGGGGEEWGEKERAWGEMEMREVGIDRGDRVCGDAISDVPATKVWSRTECMCNRACTRGVQHLTAMTLETTSFDSKSFF